MSIYRLKKATGTVIYHALMLLFCFVMAYPLIWNISSSLKETKDVIRTAEQLWVSNPHWENYINGWKGFGGYTFTTYFKNAFIMAGFNTITAVVGSSLVAFGFARVRFTGRKFWFGLMIAMMCLPLGVTQIPKYIMFKNMGWERPLTSTFIPSLEKIPSFNPPALVSSHLDTRI